MRAWTWMAVTVQLFAGAVAMATLPDDQTINYWIREDPTDETSAAIFEITLDLEAIETRDNRVKWEVMEMRLGEVGSNGVITTSWTKTHPTVSTSDGYWVTDHADFSNILPKDFNNLPTMVGTADADVSGDDLDYDIQGAGLTQIQSAMYSGSVAGMTYEFKEENQTVPLHEGEDEPEEIGPGEDDPPLES